LNSNGLVFKIYRDHFGSIPVEVAGNSLQPNVTDPVGGEQPAVKAGSATFPLDVAGRVDRGPTHADCSRARSDGRRPSHEAQAYRGVTDWQRNVVEAREFER